MTKNHLEMKQGLNSDVRNGEKAGHGFVCFVAKCYVRERPYE